MTISPLITYSSFQYHVSNRAKIPDSLGVCTYTHSFTLQPTFRSWKVDPLTHRMSSARPVVTRRPSISTPSSMSSTAPLVRDRRPNPGGTYHIYRSAAMMHIGKTHTGSLHAPYRTAVQTSLTNRKTAGTKHLSRCSAITNAATTGQICVLDHATTLA